MRSNICIFYGSLEESIPFPFLRIFQLQIPFRNDSFPTALCWVFCLLPNVGMRAKISSVWPHCCHFESKQMTEATGHSQVSSDYCRCCSPTVPTEGLPSSSPSRAGSLPTDSACPCILPSAWAHWEPTSCLHQPFLNHNLTEEFPDFIAESIDSRYFHSRLISSRILTSGHWSPGKPYFLYISQNHVYSSALTKCALPTLIIITDLRPYCLTSKTLWESLSQFLCLWTSIPCSTFCARPQGSRPWRNDLISPLMGPKALNSPLQHHQLNR